jgi:FkbM family methyltransferase
MKRKRTARRQVVDITRAVVSHPANRHRKVRALVRAYGWQIYKRATHLPVVVAFHGLRLRCYPDSNSASNVIYFGERFDVDELTFLERYLRPGDRFIDVGANIGTYTLAAASLVGPTGHVDAFEPFPRAAARLHENLRLNRLGNVAVHELAIAGYDGTAEFLADFDVSNAIKSDSDRAGGVVHVETKTLDDALTSGYAMAKLDVEGIECEALRGARRLLRRADPPVWQIEVLDHQLRKFGCSTRELLDLFATYGFTFATYDSSAAELVMDSAYVERQQNRLAIFEPQLPEVLARVRAESRGAV